MIAAIRARYDAAQTTPENAKHWTGADGLSADAANSPTVRRIIRKRARYEVANNPTLAGVVRTLVNDTIGTGPRLQVKLPSNRKLASAIEQAWKDWARETKLASKLWTGRHARAVDGESFAALRNNPRLLHPVKLDVQLMEADRFTDPRLLGTEPRNVDGISLDDIGNPLSYTVLSEHPGNSIAWVPSQVATIDAMNILHWFVAHRPEQHRGVCEFVASLPLGAHLRRFSTATLNAAELIALLSTFIEVEAPGEAGDGPNGPEYFDTLALGPMQLTTVPKGSAPQQVEAEQPATTFTEFHNAHVGMMARPLCMTYSLAAGDFSRTSFAASRMEDRNYGASIDIDRELVEEPILSRIFAAWFEEAKLIGGLLPPEAQALAYVSHEWGWNSRPHVDPGKVSTARATDLRSGATTLAQVYAEQGRDWFDEIQQIATEAEFLNSHGMAHPFQVQPGASDTQQTDSTDAQQTDGEGDNADAAQ